MLFHFQYCIYVRHLANCNNKISFKVDTLQCNVKAKKKKKKKTPCLNKSDPIYMYDFDNAIAFKDQSISLFWYLDNFLVEDKTGLLLQINIT